MDSLPNINTYAVRLDELFDWGRVVGLFYFDGRDATTDAATNYAMIPSEMLNVSFVPYKIYTLYKK